MFIKIFMLVNGVALKGGFISVCVFDLRRKYNEGSGK